MGCGWCVSNSNNHVDSNEGNRMVEWLSANWEWVLLGFMVLEKAVKLSPTDKDDILVDMVFKGLIKLVKKEELK